MARVVTIPIGPIFTGGFCRGVIHVIQKGDTLYRLGQRYGVRVSDIMYANPYVDIYNLQVGDELCIPVAPMPPERPMPQPPKPQPPERPMPQPPKPQPPERPMPQPPKPQPPERPMPQPPKPQPREQMFEE